MKSYQLCFYFAAPILNKYNNFAKIICNKYLFI